MTATRSYVSIAIGTDRGWAYATGSTDSPEVHYGLLGIADALVLSALDDRLFVASSASFLQDPLSAPAAWLIDSVTGQRGALRWVDAPTTLDSAEQTVALFPADPIPCIRSFLLRSLIPANGSCLALSTGATGRSGR